MSSPPSHLAVDDWDTHWSDLGAAARLNPAQEYRRRLCLQLLGRDGFPRRLLDIGSGTGEFLGLAHRRWPQALMVGLEMSRVGVEQASLAYPDVHFEVCDLLAAARDAGVHRTWATHAVCSEVLEHVDDPSLLLRNARMWLAPGARVVVTVPGGPMSAYDRHIGHRRHFSPRTLTETLHAAGFEVLLTMRAGFPWFNVYRGLVILAGDRLVRDAGADSAETLGGRLTRTAMLAFRPLFVTNLPRTPFGWQTVAVAREPGSA